MSARSRHHWLAWLLPLIALRAFVPAGFMFSFGTDGPELVLCSGMGAMPRVTAVAVPTQQQHEHHAHHAHHEMVAADATTPETHHQSDSSSASHQNSICPFALVYAANIAAADVVPAGWSALSGMLVALPSASQPRSVAVLIDRIRGPPFA